MTIPASVPLPTPPTSPDQTPDYLRRLNVALQGQYGQLAAAINNAPDPAYNIDGGDADSIYAPSQHIDCGGA
jgi:hypothetical protein